MKESTAMNAPTPDTTSPTSAAGKPSDGKSSGPGRLLITVYAIFAVAATSRAGYQIATKFSEAPVAYVLSAVAAVVYIAATISLARRGAFWYKAAVLCVSVELLGVLVIGTLSLLDSVAFPDATVWSVYGKGYLFIPVVLPVLGLIWLYRNRPSVTAARKLQRGA